MTNPLQRIKAKQIADALDAGVENPYESSLAVTIPAEPAFNIQNKLHNIKAKQLAENPEMYGKPIIIGFDPARPGSERTIVLPVGNYKQMFEQLKAAMETDVARLKNTPDIEDKATVKAELIKPYLPFVEQYMAEGHSYPNSVAVTVMIWLFDIGDIEQALKLGLYLVETKQNKTPDHFTRNLEAFIGDAVHDWSQLQLKENQSASPYLETFMNVVTNDKLIIPADLHGKLFAMLAKHAFAKGNYHDTVAFCDAAEKVDSAAQVKTLKKKAQKEVDKLPIKTGVQTYIDKLAPTE